MLKKITTVISNNKVTIGRKARLVGGVILGIGIGILMNKPDEPDMVIIEKIEDITYEDSSDDIVGEGENDS